MRLKAKRWNDPKERDDGWRLLVTRYRPRGVSKADETWDDWWPQLGPSRELHAAYFGKTGEPIDWPEYERRYLAEIKSQERRLAEVASRARKEAVTLLCSSHCVDPSRCHRSLLLQLLRSRADAATLGP